MALFTRPHMVPPWVYKTTGQLVLRHPSCDLSLPQIRSLHTIIMLISLIVHVECLLQKCNGFGETYQTAARGRHQRYTRR